MELEREFEKKVLAIRTKNYIAIIEKLKQFIIDDELYKTGLLITEKEANFKAREKFCEAKKNGIYDSLNFKVVQDV